MNISHWLTLKKNVALYKGYAPVENFLILQITPREI